MSHKFSRTQKLPYFIQYDRHDGYGINIFAFHGFILTNGRAIVKRKKHISHTRFIKKNMNGIFALVFLLSGAVFFFVNPDGFLSAMLAGGQKAATLSLSLLAIYCVWLGFFNVMEESKLSEKFSALVYPLSRRIFRSNDKEALTYASQNLTANFLGLPGAPTPLGVKATQTFLKNKNEYAADMLFVLNATSLQLLPTTVITLRAAAGAASPADIVLPTLLSTLVSTLLGGVLVYVTRKRK